MDQFLTPDFLKFFIPLMGAVVGWFLNERRKRTWEEYMRKEERYRALLESMDGFYVQTHDSEEKSRFLRELNKCWLYCPDAVIRAGYRFLRTISVERKASEGEKAEALGSFVVALRQDLISRNILRRTTLKAEDFRHYFAK